MASVEDGAKEILRVAVREQNTRANDVVALEPVVKRFNTLPWRHDELMPAVVHAQQQGWLTPEGRLTAVGFAAAFKVLT